MSLTNDDIMTSKIITDVCKEHLKILAKELAEERETPLNMDEDPVDLAHATGVIHGKIAMLKHLLLIYDLPLYAVDIDEEGV